MTCSTPSALQCMTARTLDSKFSPVAMTTVSQFPISAASKRSISVMSPTIPVVIIGSYWLITSSWSSIAMISTSWSCRVFKTLCPKIPNPRIPMVRFAISLSTVAKADTTSKTRYRKRWPSGVTRQRPKSPRRKVNWKITAVPKERWTKSGAMVRFPRLVCGKPSNSLRAKRIKTKKVVIFIPPAVPPGAPPRNICKR